MSETTTPEAPDKWRCENCGWVGSEHLSAPNPFNPTDTVSGCPGCWSVDSLEPACAATGCERPGTSGVPGALGYRYAWVCWDHNPHRAEPPQ